MYQKILKVITALAVVGFTAGQATAATVSLTQPSPILTGGASTLSVTLVGTDFTTAVDGGAFTFNWDPTVLDLGPTVINPGPPASSTGGIVIANPPWDTFSISDADRSLGTVDFVFLGQSAGASGPNFDIATINFNVVGAVGSTTNVSFADSAFGGWVAPGGVPVAVTYVDGLVSVTPVPVPAAVWLFGSGLLGLVGVARRRG